MPVRFVSQTVPYWVGQYRDLQPYGMTETLKLWAKRIGNPIYDQDEVWARVKALRRLLYAKRKAQ